MKTIKSISITLFIALAIITTSCKKDKDETNNTGKTGTFTIDGVSYAGNTSTDVFVNDNYSVLCEQDDPYKLIQITFHNQAEAEAGGTFDVADFGLNVPSGEAEVGIGGLTFDPDGSQTITVTDKKITINNLELRQTGGGSLSPFVKSAIINF
ncbi:MAG: hypothetical protein IPH74_11235 [Bacteroidetes bacterium]|jgi:hypothetical protein|nr:hypothetical protein [Bacteroidota bacterium]MBP7257480.1 hypothetical protein [Chitinophagales bacterium]MBK7139556.1 hypothetical protein [Bacteroidota bacterium]MBK7504862.1 hypothetical protein [Bacteroidota bacterium]MBK7638786.1 hypothetical protein [Bacteroidota bacterium]